MPLPITARHPKALHPEGRPPPDAPDWIEQVDNPYLHGLFAPVDREHPMQRLELLRGEIPPDLRGLYVRNGPNPIHPPPNRYHWFDGDGYVHGLWFEGGEARYSSRWIRTRGMRAEQERGAAIWGGVLGPFDLSLPGGPLKDTANTDVVIHRSRLLALWYESGQPYALDPTTLETLDAEVLEPGLPRRISAHSKRDPNTGDFLFFSYGDRPPYLSYGVLRPDGRVHHEPIELPGPRRPHDMGLTPNYSILHDFPVFFDPEHFRRTGKRVPLFHREVPTRFGVIPRFGRNEDVRWFEFEPCYMLHVVNAWEEGEELVMIGCRTADPTLRPDPKDGRIAAMLSGLKLQANLHEWRMNLQTGRGSERPLDDLNAEFPMISEGWLGRRNRYSYHQVIPYEIPATFDALVKYDLRSGARERFDYGPGIFGSEAPFAPRIGATEEDDGYVLTLVTDVRSWRSACWIFDARAIADGPIAELALPGRAAAGFHSTWMPAAELP